jgi:hypothetical protein
MVLWLASLALAQDCPKPGLEMISEGTAALWDAYARVNITAFDAASVVIRNGVHCVDTPLDPHTVAELHRTMAIIAFAAGQEVPSKKSWLAARFLDPSWVLPMDLYPENHPIRVMFEESVPPPPDPAGKPADEQKALEDGPGVHWLVDGLPASTVPLDRAFVLQALDDDRKVIYTGYLWSIIDIPSLRVGPPQGLHTAIARLGASATAGMLLSDQSGDGAFVEQHPTAPVGSLELRARLQPTRPIGADLAAEGLGLADPLAGAWATPAVRAALTIGWDARTDDRRIRGVIRPGIEWGRLRAWSGAAEAPAATEFTAPTVSVGAGFEYATEDLAVDASVEPSFLFDGTPWQLATEGSVEWSMTELVALEAGLRVAPSLGAYSLIDAGSGEVLAGRRDTPVRAAFGIVIYR